MVQLRQDDDLYRSGEVGRLFGVEAQTVAKWARQGRIKSILTPGGRRRYPAGPVNEQLHQWGLLAPAGELPGQFALPL